MKTKHLILLGALTFGSTLLSFAQSAGGNGNGPTRGPGGRAGGPPPPNPLLALFDTNHDGVIDAAEIAAASDVLRTLDQNRDGVLNPDELRPPGGLRAGGPGNNPNATTDSGGTPYDNGPSQAGPGGRGPGGGRGRRGGPPPAQN